MTKWVCANLANKANHPEIVLYDDDPATAIPAPPGSANDRAEFRVPTPEYCKVCERYYLPSECTKVER